MMRYMPGYSLVFVLVVLLVSTTPMGTGTGVHAFDLVHPLFSHIHVVGGRVMTHEQIAQERANAAADKTTLPGPALGAGSNLPTADGLGLTSTALDDQPIEALLAGLTSAPPLMDVDVPAGREVAPPDPPPLA